MADEKIYLADGFKAIGQCVGSWCMNNRAHICTAVGISGTIVTGVLAARSGARAARRIDRKERELGRLLTTGEKVKLCGKDFILPAATAAVSVAGTLGSDVLNTKTIGIQNAALIASEQAYQKLSEKTKEVLGEKKAKQIEDEIAKEEIHKPGVITQEKLDNAPRSGNGELHPFMDSYSKMIFWSNLDYINCVIKELNDMMRDLAPRGDSFDYYDKMIGVRYSDWLERLGFEKRIWNCTAFREHGWNKGFSKDGEDDDPIEYVRTTEEYYPGFAVTYLTWEVDPIPMRLGRMIKASGY